MALMQSIILRHYRSEDCAEIVQLFYDTIHTVNAADYSPSQLDAWAPKVSDRPLADWDHRFLKDHAVVAEKDGVIVGIGTVKGPAYFDLLYVHKDYQRKGVATLIADEIEKYFKNGGIKVITTDASITAKPFFESRGYHVIKQQCVETRGQYLINFKMEKVL